VTIAGLLIWLVHTLGLRRVETREERTRSWLGRVHRFGLLALFGVSGLVALPFAAYELLRYVVIHGDALSHSPPGPSVAIALVLTPVWLYELLQVIRTVARPGSITPAG